MKNWWKYLAVVLILYTLVAGMKIPLKPGILSCTPTKITTGIDQVIRIQAYNMHCDSAEEVNVWLRLDSINYIKAKNINVISSNVVDATFNVGQDILGEEKKVLTLVVDNELDGFAPVPSAIYIEKGLDIEGTATTTFPKTAIKEADLFRFPFQYPLYETIRNLFFHVAIWFAMFLLLILSCYHSIIYLTKKRLDSDIYASALTSVALVFGIAGLLTGSMWAKYTWGAFWTNDIKLNMSAVAIAIYFAFWILRSAITDVDTRARVSAVYNIFAFICLMILVMVIPRLTDGLHPGNGGNPALGGQDLDNTLRTVFYPAIIGYSLLGLWISQLYYRMLKLKDYLLVQ